MHYPFYPMMMPQFAALPAPGSQGAPLFDRTDATEFLQKLQDTCHRCGIQKNEDILGLLPQYCSRDIRIWVEAQTSWKAKDWENFRAEFLEHYYETDTQQRKFSKEYLHYLSSIQRNDRDDLQGYIDSFDIISTKVFEKGHISDVERASMLIQGLPTHMKEKVVRDFVKKRLPRDTRISYREAYDLATLQIVTKTYAQTYLTQFEHQRHPEVNPQQEKAQYRPPQPSKSHSQNQFSSQPRNDGGDMQALRDQIEALTLQVKASEAMVQQVKASKDMRNDPRYEPDRHSPSNGLGVHPNLRCFTCGGNHYSATNQCEELRNMEGHGIIHVLRTPGQKDQYLLGTAAEPGPPAYNIRGQLNKDSFRQQYEQWKRQQARPQAGANIARGVLPAPSVTPLLVNNTVADLNGIPPSHAAASVNSVGAVLIGSSPAWENLEDSDIDESMFPSGEVNAVEGRTAKRRKDNDVARTRNSQTGRYQPRVEEVVDDDIMQDRPPDDSQTQQAQQPLPQRSVPTAHPVTREEQAPRRARGPVDPKVSTTRNLLSDIIMRKIWETTITLTIGELAGAAPRIRAGMGRGTNMEMISQQISEVLSNAHPDIIPSAQANSSGAAIPSKLQKQIDRLARDAVSCHATRDTLMSEEDYIKNVTVQANYGAVKLSDELPALQPREMSRSLLYVDVFIGSRKIRACIDCGSSVNIIRQDIAQAIGAQLRLNPRLRLVPVDGGEFAVSACIESLPISIGDVVVESHTMVGEHCTNELLLGRLWAKDSLLQYSERPDGRVLCTIFNADRTKQYSFVAYRPSDGGSFYEDQLWPEAYALKVNAGK
jgi:hypothetical protein